MKISTLITLLSAMSVWMTAHAQMRKHALPDTVTQEVILQDLLYRHPPEDNSFSEEKVFGDPYQQPEYPGGVRAMYEFIQANLRMPQKAKRARISGRVFVSFLVKETGEIGNITVLKGLGFGCDEEAVRLVRSMPRWKPGKVHNKPHSVKYNLPIAFVSK